MLPILCPRCGRTIREGMGRRGQNFRMHIDACQGPKKKRRYSAPHPSVRCQGVVTLADGSEAQCMHKRSQGRMFCRQH